MYISCFSDYFYEHYLYNNINHRKRTHWKCLSSHSNSSKYSFRSCKRTFCLWKEGLSSLDTNLLFRTHYWKSYGNDLWGEEYLSSIKQHTDRLDRIARKRLKLFKASYINSWCLTCLRTLWTIIRHFAWNPWNALASRFMCSWIWDRHSKITNCRIQRRSW